MEDYSMKSKMFICAALVSMIMGSQVANVDVFASEDIAVVDQQNSQLHKIKVRGVIDLEQNTSFTLNFNTNENKIEVTDIQHGGYGIHDGFYDNKYIEFKLYDKNGEKKAGLELIGTDKTSKAMELNNTPFEYGDYITIYHQEPHARLHFIGKEVTDLAKDNYNVYRITKNGLQQIFEIKNEIQMRGIGYKGAKYQGFDIKFDTLEKKIKIANMLVPNSRIHAYYGNNPYMKMKLYNENETKASVTIRGNDPASIANELNNQPFEYGDTLEIYHAEGHYGDHRYNVTEMNMGQRGTKYIYKITKNGLKLISVNK